MARSGAISMELRDVRFTVGVLTSLTLVLLAGCRDSSAIAGFPEGDMCTIPPGDLLNGGPGKDGIPALTEPELVSIADPGATYLKSNERVIGLLSAAGPLAVPLQILWWHEIVNISVDGRKLAVTHCPLTGSSLVFDRGPLGGVEFGVSGLLYRNNLVMYDRSSGESLWPQMSRGARCGPRVGLDLTMVPAIEMTWEGWVDLHPDTRVVSSRTGHVRDYGVYPYGVYDAIDNPTLLFPLPGPIDPRRPPKERVLGVPGDGGPGGPSGEREPSGVAYPFGELAAAGTVAAIPHDANASRFGPGVVLWDSTSQAAALFLRTLDGIELTFQVSGDVITDLETGSEWGVDGLATSGPLGGSRLTPVAEAYVAYWFAWAVFEPGTSIWRVS